MLVFTLHLAGANITVNYGNAREETNLYRGWTWFRADDMLIKDKKETIQGQTVTIPHDWQILEKPHEHAIGGGSQGYFPRKGICWYRTELDLPENATQYVWQLAFDGIYERPSIYVNGELAGQWHYGYMSFYLNISKFVKPGNNVIAVRVDNSDSWGSRWYSGAGITGAVRLIRTGTSFIDEYGINSVTKYDKVTGIGTATITADIISPTWNQLTFEAQLSHNGQLLDKKEGVLQDKTFSLDFVEKDVMPWTADTPELYDLTLILKQNGKTSDVRKTKIGFRTVEFLGAKGGAMLVNGKPEMMRGVCLHTDLGSIGTAAAENIWKERLTILKNYGINAIRCSHNPYPPFVYDLCDELGFYVIAEILDHWKFPYLNNEEIWTQIIGNFLRRERRHPSIVIWTVGNEVNNEQGSDSMVAVLKKYTDFVRKNEPTRPVSIALAPFYANMPKTKDFQRSEFRAIDRMEPYLDVILLNYQEPFFDEMIKRYPNKSVLSSEAFQYYTNPYDVWNNDSFIEKTPWMFCENKPGVAGMFIWTGVAYLGESQGWNSRGWPQALIQTDHSVRPGAYLYQAYWSKKPMVHVVTLDSRQRSEMGRPKWGMPKYGEHWNFEPQEIVHCSIYSNCDEVQVIVGNSWLQKYKPSDFPNRVIQCDVPYVGNPLRVIGYNKGRQVAEHTIHHEAPAKKLTVKASLDELPFNEYKLAYVRVSAEDEHGIKTWNADNRIHFTIEGAGEIVGIDNGNLLNDYSYQGNELPLYHGNATAIVRANSSGSGDIKISVSADGLSSAETVIHVVDTPSNQHR